MPTFERAPGVRTRPPVRWAAMDAAYLLLPIAGAFVLLFLSCCCAHKVKNLMQVHEGLSHSADLNWHSQSDVEGRPSPVIAGPRVLTSASSDKLYAPAPSQPVITVTGPWGSNSGDNTASSTPVNGRIDLNSQYSLNLSPSIVVSDTDESDDSGKGETPVREEAPSQHACDDAFIPEDYARYQRRLGSRGLTVAEVHSPVPKPPSPPP